MENESINEIKISCTDRIASTFLGKKVSGSEFYNPSLLVAVPRTDNRSRYGILDDGLPFAGFDVWHAYEFSTLTDNGLPVTKLMKIKYSCESEYIIESKSLKLYLNSYNMTRQGTNISEALLICKQLIEKDLSDALKTVVDVNFIDNNTKRIGIFDNYRNLMDFADEMTIKINEFKEAPRLLSINETPNKKEYYLSFDSLRSNCRVTHQPDFGDVFIYYKSSKHIEETNLLKYLVSFRSEFHFHEECCEMIYKRLYDLLDADDELSVAALYTRRGGIDICPVRWSKNCKTDDDICCLTDITKFARNGVKQ